MIALAAPRGVDEGARLRVSPGAFALAFLPVLVVGGWILVATQPGNGWQEGRLHSWSHSIGILGVVHAVGLWHGVLAFALGLVLGLSLDGVPAPVEEARCSEPRGAARGGRARRSRAPLRRPGVGRRLRRDSHRGDAEADTDPDSLSLTGDESIRGRLERVRRPRIPTGRDHAHGVGPRSRSGMNVLPRRRSAGGRLLLAHLESLDPQAVQARERLEERLGHELAHKLVFALAPHGSDRRAA